MAREAAAEGQEHAVADGKAEALIDVLEAVDVDEHDRRTIGLAFAGAGDGALQPVHEQLAVGEAGQAVMHRVMHQPLVRALEARDVAHQPDAAEHARIVARRRPGAKLVPEIGPVLTLEAELGLQIAALIFLERPQHQTEALAVRGVHVLEEIVDGGVERAWWRSERLLDLGVDGDVVLGRVPLPDGGARAVDGERLDLHLAHRPELKRAAGRAEGELGDGKAEQHQDEDKAGQKSGHHDVA